MAVAEEHGFESIAFPLIGAGSGGFDLEKAKENMLDELQILDSAMTLQNPSLFQSGTVVDLFILRTSRRVSRKLRPYCSS